MESRGASFPTTSVTACNCKGPRELLLETIEVLDGDLSGVGDRCDGGEREGLLEIPGTG